MPAERRRHRCRLQHQLHYRGYINGKENGNYYGILGLYMGNGKENGNYNSILGLYGGYVRIMRYMPVL